MTGLKDLLKKKDKIEQTSGQNQGKGGDDLATPEFRFIRTTTESEEVIQPPLYPGDEPLKEESSKREKKRHTLGFRKSSNAAYNKDPTGESVRETSGEKDASQLPIRPRADRRLSERFHLHRDRSRSASAETSSQHLPDDLPEAPAAVPAPATEGSKIAAEEKELSEQREVQWEKRATILAQSNPLLEEQLKQREKTPRSRSPSISDQGGDENIQEAIRLHEAGDLEPSTAMFGRLANPKGANNALAQVLYGLALRHGWGITSEPEKAIHYLSLAASNSASVEEQALASGMKKGGAAKGELVLAIFELANCFRHGWGVKKDPVAARQYYETAANLGDTDAMEEAAWCLMEGFGGGKDKVRALLHQVFALCHKSLFVMRSPTVATPMNVRTTFNKLWAEAHLRLEIWAQMHVRPACQTPEANVPPIAQSSSILAASGAEG
jgi:TPR repeat protein